MPFDATTFRQSENESPVVARLRLGRERVAQPGGWAQWVLSDDVFKVPRFCARGAIMIPAGASIRCYDFNTWCDKEPEIWQAAEWFLTIAVYGSCDNPPTIQLVNWNNAYSRTQDEVVAAFDRAIELALAEEMANA